MARQTPDPRPVAAAGILAVLCCAGPLIVASGALSVVGRALFSPWVGIGVVSAVVLLVLLSARNHRRRRHLPQ
jgi:hypothetical protein